MQLYILRHGDAPYNALKRERCLSAVGRTETLRIAERHATELAAVPLIVCSPVRRARETLAVLEQSLPVSAEVLFHDCLRSESRIQAVEAFMDNLNADVVLFVSHQPLVGQMLNYLTDQQSAGMAMGTSCLALLDLIAFGRGCASLRWLDCP